MEVLVWIGTALTLAGLVLLMWCVREGVRAKRSSEDDDALRARLQRIVPVNLGALALSAIGLMMVMLGVFLG
jgi:uncharacterized membrane protein